MPFVLSPHARFALVVVVLAAAAAGMVAGSGEVAAVALVGGVAAVLAALGSEGGARPAPASDGAAADAADAGGVAEAIGDPVLIVRAGRVEAANRPARRLLGEHVVGEDVRTAIRHPAASEALASDSGARTAELVGLGGRDQHWELTVGDVGGGRRLVHLRDRTGRHAADRMRVDFVANASHELRTPLASILGYVETLADDAGEDPATRARFLRIVMDEATRMDRLVGDLMSLSRIEAEKYRLPDTAIALGEVVAAACREIADAGDPRAADIRLTLAPALPQVCGDRAQLSQLVHNLVGNAMKYGRAGTPIGVAVTRAGNSVRLEVSDEGDGIPAEHLPRLTERFYRVDAGRSRSLGGTGLGLAIVKHIAERHRGRLDIASTPGVGTRVAVLMPPADEAVIKPSRP